MQHPEPDQRPDMQQVADQLPKTRRLPWRWIALAAALVLAVAGVVLALYVRRTEPGPAELVVAFDHEVLRTTGSSVTARLVNRTTGSREGIQWLWTFGDGATSTEESPVYQFTCTPQRKSFSVSLRASNRYDPIGETLEKRDLIQITPPPAPAPRVRAIVLEGCPSGGVCAEWFAERSAPVLQCEAPCRVRFRDTSGGNPKEVCWRPAATAAERCGANLEIDHEYRTPGSFTAVRRAIHDCGQTTTAVLRLRVTTKLRPGPSILKQ
jgi:hypothetical protein